MSTDVSLQEQVLNELRWERGVDPVSLRVVVHDGYVTLAGEVSSAEVRAAAEWAASRVSGVRGVESELVVRETAPRIVQ